ncbi:MAG: hypothetical protein HYV08_09735 [Deltaproteobacteria bacterium]|nr:hypothetical protein [Deltaproteobacteria bacterium]MBI3075502.1 hypothetical protein [Deltaproteobacteria bacterium]
MSGGKEKRWSPVLLFAVSVSGMMVIGASCDKGAAPKAHVVRMTVFEAKGSTSVDKLAPPAIHPRDLSHGYSYTAPGELDRERPREWQVASYLFSPSFVTVKRGDTVSVTVFVVNGDEHQIRIMDPDGEVVVPETKWNRGREYQASFRATRPGGYQLICTTHAPTMTATFFVLE